MQQKNLEKHKIASSPLRRFIVGWVAVLVAGFVVLGGGLSLAIGRLHAQTERIYIDSQSLQVNHQLEADALSAERLALIDENQKNQRRQAERAEVIADGQKTLWALNALSQNDLERPMAAEISGRFAALENGLKSSATSQAEQQLLLDDLIKTLHEHRALQRRQMTQTRDASTRLDNLLDKVMMTLLLLSSLILFVGVAELWKRIFRPALELEKAARAFGEGNLQARARVLRHDEMGRLNETFNTMAEALGEREKERLHFVATVAHDLKNPLVVIGGAAHLLENKTDALTPQERARWTKSIARNAHQMENLIADLTDGVQSETGELNLHCAHFDLAALVREVMQDQNDSVQTHALHCDAKEACFIHADKRRIERVLMNLVSNAIKYSAPGSEICVSVVTKNAFAHLEVRDEGAGIAPDELKTLFRPFARLERTQNMAKGTGLGLSSVKKIVEAHGGIIEIESEVEQGTLVRLKLPFAAKE